MDVLVAVVTEPLPSLIVDKISCVGRMETFQESAVLMLREFRALLQFSPVPIEANRFLQLLALNMAAIDNTQLKGKSAIFHAAYFRLVAQPKRGPSYYKGRSLEALTKSLFALQ